MYQQELCYFVHHFLTFWKIRLLDNNAKIRSLLDIFLIGQTIFWFRIWNKIKIKGALLVLYWIFKNIYSNVYSVILPYTKLIHRKQIQLVNVPLNILQRRPILYKTVISMKSVFQFLNKMLVLAFTKCIKYPILSSDKLLQQIWQSVEFKTWFKHKHNYGL